ncbi:uncharacterized protein CYBJADRAFT_165752 [Cyberlindnera jadinii NRRL Y-1542]|uniref:Uncharacterized protein n=1 Tax=Cyberlindnera jadinii (strain ATCC 18201 / CBS 1600 / BCRC 20928 / JCM 3617 / NBRC 0987 / NRRL Y-1542) TaxID=983966 RepID=A0A1E4SAE6_CYBJN|nr:hypothetical protein CYBJADRAFT_165752 [Cyberlindnera jadinii NRRL Y-1542]ODV76474.1 hypothetical protein CYBJADRAFT_165752 [Cyberlindnera jadinii NRRL Y-1542]
MKGAIKHICGSFGFRRCYSELSSIKSLSKELYRLNALQDPRRVEDELPRISKNIITSKRIDQLTLLNYQTLVSKVSRKRNWSLLQKYEWELAPLLNNLGQNGYLQKSGYVLEVVSILEHITNDCDTESRSKILKTFRQPLLDTICFSIRLQDDTRCHDGELLRLWLLQVFSAYYGSLPPEDYHTIFYSAVLAGDAVTLKELVTGELSVNIVAGERQNFDISEEAAKRSVEIFAQRADISSIAKIWNNRPFTSYEVGLVTECASSIKDKLAVMDIAVHDNDLQLVPEDFDHLVDSISADLHTNALNRRNLTPDSSDSRKRKLNLQRVDITRFAETHFDDQFAKKDQRVKRVFVDSFLKALTSLSNTTGVVHGFTLIPGDVINIDIFNTLLHSCARGAGSPLTAMAIKKYMESVSMESELSTKWFYQATKAIEWIDTDGKPVDYTPGITNKHNPYKGNKYDKADAATLTRFFNNHLSQTSIKV